MLPSCLVSVIDSGIIAGAAAGAAVFLIAVMVVVCAVLAKSQKKKTAPTPTIGTPGPTVRRMNTPVAVVAAEYSTDIQMVTATAVPQPIVTVTVPATVTPHMERNPVTFGQTQPVFDSELPVAVARLC